MKMKMQSANPETHDYTMSVTMKLSEWLELKKELGSSTRTPIYEFRNQIDSAVHQASKVYWPDKSDD